jgi:hypothetical protein
VIPNLEVGDLGVTFPLCTGKYKVQYSQLCHLYEDTLRTHEAQSRAKITNIGLNEKAFKALVPRHFSQQELVGTRMRRRSKGRKPISLDIGEDKAPLSFIGDFSAMAFGTARHSDLVKVARLAGKSASNIKGLYKSVKTMHGD